MNEDLKPPMKQELGSPRRDRTQFARVLTACIQRTHIDTSGSVLIVGGSFEDVKVLRRIGFKHMTLSNIQSVPSSEIPSFDGVKIEVVCADAENMQLPNDSYDFVIAHEVLHHCRRPHAVLAEMLRVARRYVAFMEPNDSLFMKALVAMRFSFPYELPAVIYHNYESGGVQDSCIPNFIYRWNRNDVLKTVSAFIPELTFALHTRPYWDLSADETDLALRSQTRLHILTRLLGASNVVRGLRFLQVILNSVPVICEQGNKFFCCIEQRDQLRPWLLRNESGVVFNRAFGNGDGNKG